MGSFIDIADGKKAKFVVEVSHQYRVVVPSGLPLGVNDQIPPLEVGKHDVPSLILGEENIGTGGLIGVLFPLAIGVGQSKSCKEYG